MRIASVVVDIRHRAVSKAFDYIVPETMEPFLRTGHRVEIPFGPRMLSGIVVAFKDASDVKELKAIRALLDAEAVFDEEALALSERLATDHAAPRSEYLSAMLPPGMRMKYEKRLEINDRSRLDEALAARFGKADNIPFDASVSEHLKAVFEGLESGALKSTTRIRRRATTLTEEYVVYVQNATTRLGPKQQAVMDLLKTTSPLEKKTLLEKASASSATLNSLRKHGCLDVMSREKSRELTHIRAVEDKRVTLNDAQKAVIERLEARGGRHDTFLLHGVAASGKTEVYIELAERMREASRGFILLVSEISLTPLLTARFKARFGNDVAVYHSRLSLGEQYDEWRRMKRGEARIVVGARSAVFAPVADLGMIVIDEEHSDTYIQDDHPRYHAREVALWRTKRHDVPLVLGSATPSVESYYHALNGRYVLLEMKERAMCSAPPNVEAVDMKQEFLAGNTSMFSARLIEHLSACLQRREQALLLMNRRGTANFVMCRRCSHTIVCETCELPYTYHRFDHTLKCHHCGKYEAMPSACPKCGSAHIRYMGIGSERVERELKKRFPDAKVMRMDRDTTSAKGAHESLLSDFERDGDVLIGTQMIAKGLDFDRVTLVGVLSADMGLHVPSHFAAEDTFSLLAQMAGRSGRRARQGEVVIQAYDVEHPVILDAIEGDYRKFYDREIDYRERASQPPFKQLMRVSVLHVKPHVSFRTAAQLAGRLRNEGLEGMRIIGPLRPRIAKRGKRHVNDILIKHDADADPMPVMRAFIEKETDHDTVFDVDRHPRNL